MESSKQSNRIFKEKSETKHVFSFKKNSWNPETPSSWEWKPWQYIENVPPLEADRIVCRRRIDEDGGMALNTCAAQKVTKVWKGRSDGDGSVLGGSRAALIHNDGAELAVRIAIPAYPQVPTSPIFIPKYQKYPRVCTHNPLLSTEMKQCCHCALLKQQSAS